MIGGCFLFIFPFLGLMAWIVIAAELHTCHDGKNYLLCIWGETK